MLKYLLQYKHSSESEQFSCLAFKENEVSKNTNEGCTFSKGFEIFG